MGPVQNVLEPIKKQFPDHDIIFCEYNIRSEKDNGDEPASYWNFLLDSLEYVYQDPRVKGFLAYELLDEPDFLPNVTQAYYGMITCSPDGEIGRKKSVFNALQERYLHLQGKNK